MVVWKQISFYRIFFPKKFRYNVYNFQFIRKCGVGLREWDRHRGGDGNNFMYLF